ncbi:thiamine phosphate synthase [Nocardioides sp.]|uniref:thiamine phosphate synthase n=1 Tax=Nocardioides sp. TaxID=35761 RepID=UPI002736EE1D|nr:thiamine phosphate synthase [Nocardioides sp.]MDP3894713.1 thiamine phosphate synthase [Nocardioides sp.]
MSLDGGVVPRLMLLTDRSQLRLGRGLVRTVRECAAAGLEAVVVREHDLPPESRAALVAELATVDGLLVISSRLPDPSAHGLHLAADQPPPSTRWGRSCHTEDEVRRAAAEGAAYATLSPYAASSSKPGYGPRVDPRAFGGDHGLPVLALGGIDADNARAAIEAGAHGVAVMGCVMRATDPAAVVTALLEVLR